MIRNNFESQRCNSVPLNIINVIQPWGVILVLNNKRRIIQVSENVKDFLGKPAEELLERKAEELFTNKEAVAELCSGKDRSERSRDQKTLFFKGDNGDIPFIVTVNYKARQYLFELEPYNPEKKDSLTDTFQKVSKLLQKLDIQDDTEEFQSLVVKEVRSFTGFDRVMLYHFDENRNGKVEAEDQAPDMDESYLGLSFPASDIPAQARKLYKQNPYRMIPDVDYNPVKLLPVINPETNTFTDLSGCLLRGVAPVHTEYLKNMRVRASISIPVIVNEDLWGLIACHHRKPKLPDYGQRAAIELISGVVSRHLSALKINQSLAHKVERFELTNRFFNNFDSEKNVIENILQATEPSVLDLFSASGVAIVYNDEISKVGVTPDNNMIREVSDWLRISRENSIYHTNNAPDEVSGWDKLKKNGRGILAMSLGNEKGYGFLIAFRKEQKEVIAWGGNPYQAVVFDKDNQKYHPRKSFEKWKEEVSGVANPWTEDEVEHAKSIRSWFAGRLGLEKNEEF